MLTDTKGDTVGNSLLDFIHEFGAPSMLTFDGAKEQFGKNTLFRKTLNKYKIPYHVSSPRRPNENPAEGSIREVKRRWYRIMTKKNVPPRLWDFGLDWTCETGNLTVTSSKYSKIVHPLNMPQEKPQTSANILISAFMIGLFFVRMQVLEKLV